jgi:hypothetical protein
MTPVMEHCTVGQRHRLIAVAAVVLACGGGCHRRDAKAVAVVERELALLQPPIGMTPSDQRVGLGEMYAEGAQTYCLNDEKAGQLALDSMLRNAGWAPCPPQLPPARPFGITGRISVSDRWFSRARHSSAVGASGSTWSRRSDAPRTPSSRRRLASGLHGGFHERAA